MTMLEVTSGGGSAALRAAEAMLRTLGGESITLLLPAMGMPSDAAAQLGLVDPGVEEVSVSPVVMRDLATENNGPRRRMEFLLPGSAVAALLAGRNVDSARDFFDGVLGLVHDGELFHVEGVTGERFAGTTYLYRVVAVQ